MRPSLQLDDERRASVLANGRPLSGRHTIDGALDVEHGVDAPDHLQGDRWDDRKRRPAPTSQMAL
jgi:hypothetical protein